MIKHRLALLVVVCLPGCSSAYLSTVGAYGETASDALDVLSGASDISASLCHKRAELDYLFKRMSANTLNDKVLSWANYESTVTSELVTSGATPQTWKQHCDYIVLKDEVIANAMIVLAAYSSQLAHVAAHDDELGADVTSLADNTSALVSKLGAPDSTSGVLKSLSAPLSSLVGIIVDKYTSGQVASIVRQADPHVKLLLTGVQKYLVAVSLEVDDAQHQLDDVLGAVDIRLNQSVGGAVPGPADLFTVVNWAEHWRADVASTRSALMSAAAAVKTLSDAHEKLRVADGSNDAPELEHVLRSITLVLKNIQAVRAAAGGTGGEQ